MPPSYGRRTGRPRQRRWKLVLKRSVPSTPERTRRRKDAPHVCRLDAYQKQLPTPSEKRFGTGEGLDLLCPEPPYGSASGREYAPLEGKYHVAISYRRAGVHPAGAESRPAFSTAEL